MTNPYVFFIDITIGKSSKNRCSQKKKKKKKLNMTNTLQSHLTPNVRNKINK